MESICIQIINKFYLFFTFFASMVFMLLISFSQNMVGEAV